MMKRYLSVVMIHVLLLSSFCVAQARGIEDQNDLARFRGQWKGTYQSEPNVEEDIVLDINPDRSERNALVSSDAWNLYFYPMNVEVKDGQMILTMNDEAHRLTISLCKGDVDVLNGTFEQYGQTSDLNLTKTSESPAFGQTHTNAPTYTAAERKQQLIDYALFAQDGVTIPFTYDLNNRTEYENIISEYNLDALTDGRTDVDLMITLLNWVCDHFRHNGSSGFPDQRNANAIIAYCKERPSGINCRGVSILLAEILRVYGIPAKHIVCLPKEARPLECHVVVHAYSEALGQWIMLDPTYRLILKDENGDYMNLAMLRDVLIHDTKIVPNANAGWNGTAFSVDEYKYFMIPNMFRFSCATDFYYGAEESYNGNIGNMLVPVNYTEESAERTTTSEEAFWMLPYNSPLDHSVD